MRDRTADLLRARQALSQLSYSPVQSLYQHALVGLGGFEPPTSPLSGVRSNQLSYRPITLNKEPGGSADPGNTLASTDKTKTGVWTLEKGVTSSFKEVIQPQVPLGLPCYDFTPVMNHKVVSDLPKVSLPTSFAAHSHGVTGGVYKARERIHRDILIRDY